MGDQCGIRSSRRVSQVLFCAAVFFCLLIHCEADATPAPKQSADEDGRTPRSTEEQASSADSATTNDDGNDVDVPRSCWRCSRVCRCDAGIATSKFRDAKMCDRCCKRPQCINFKSEDFENAKLRRRMGRKLRRKSKRATDSPRHVHIQVIGDAREFRKRRYPKLATKEPVLFRDGDVLTGSSEMKIAGRRIKHGWVESNETMKNITDKHSPRLFYDNVRIRTSGMYHVYAQVVFRYERSQHSSFVLRKYLPEKPNGGDGEIMAQCEGTSSLSGIIVYQSSCYTATYTYLERGTKIRVECNFLNELRCPSIIMKGKRTFYGVMSMS